MDAEHLKRILIVDDESDVTELLDYKFKQAGYAIRTLNDPLRAIGLARDFRPDLIILDVMMPELTGVQLLRMVRADALLQDTPVIFLTAKGETIDKVKGLESGADDYVTKPFDTRELMLRAQALLRRAKSAAAKPSTRLAAGALMLDIERHEVTASGKIVELTATEFKLLRLLLERKGRGTVTRRAPRRRLELFARPRDPHGRHPRPPPAREARPVRRRDRYGARRRLPRERLNRFALARPAEPDSIP